MYRKAKMGQYQIDKSDDASARIQEALVTLLQDNLLPDSPTQRAEAIAQRGKVSHATLYKKYNIPLWHPRYTSFEMLLSE